MIAMIGAHVLLTEDTGVVVGYSFVAILHRALVLGFAASGRSYIREVFGETLSTDVLVKEDSGAPNDHSLLCVVQGALYPVTCQVFLENRVSVLCLSSTDTKSVIEF